MLERLLGSSEEDICPNCGTVCLASDVLCPKCGKNLDALYEQLPPGWSGARPILHFSPEHGFVAMWVAATAIGVAVSEVSWIQWGCHVNLYFRQGGVDLSPLMYALETDLTTGIIVGTLQWILLRNRIPHSWRCVQTGDIVYGCSETWYTHGFIKVGQQPG
jgi:hypothetical protein